MTAGKDWPFFPQGSQKTKRQSHHHRGEGKLPRVLPSFACVLAFQTIDSHRDDTYALQHAFIVSYDFSLCLSCMMVGPSILTAQSEKSQVSSLQ